MADGAMYDVAGNTAAQRADPVYGRTAQGGVRADTHGGGEHGYDTASPGKTSVLDARILVMINMGGCFYVCFFW